MRDILEWDLTHTLIKRLSILSFLPAVGATYFVSIGWDNNRKYHGKRTKGNALLKSDIVWLLI